MGPNKQAHQFRMWIATAISKSRKSPTGKVSYASVVPQLNTNTAFSYMQWAMSAGWLHTDGHNVYEARKTTGWPMSEILHELNKDRI